MRNEEITEPSVLPIIPILCLVMCISGCAGSNSLSSSQRGYVEIDNPAFTMSPSSPEKIWVPRESVETGAPRGGDAIKNGYESIKNFVTSAPQQTSAPVQAVAPSQAGIAGPAGKPAKMIQNFGMVIAVDGDKVYFNIGREAGYFYGQVLKIYRGGTVIEGLGLAPGELIGKIDVLGYVGIKGGYGILKQGGPVRINDLVGVE